MPSNGRLLDTTKTPGEALESHAAGRCDVTPTPAAGRLPDHFTHLIIRDGTFAENLTGSITAPA